MIRKNYYVIINDKLILSETGDKIKKEETKNGTPEQENQNAENRNHKTKYQEHKGEEKDEGYGHWRCRRRYKSSSKI